MVKAITKVLLLNFALMKMTGTGMSGWGGRVGGRLMRGMAPGGAISGVLGKQTTIRGEVSTLIEILKARKGGMSVLSGETLPVAKTPTVVSAVVAMFSRTGPMFTRIAPIMLRFATTVLRWFPLITLILIIIGVVRSAIQTIRQNINSVGTYLSEIVNTIRDRFSVIGDMFSSITGPVGDIVDSLGMIGDFFNDQMSGFLAMAGTLMDGIMHTIQTIIYMIANLRKAILYPVETFKKGWEITGKLTAEKTRQREIAAIERKMAEIRKRKKDAEDTRPPKTVNDFRGSHFSIDQRFAEGFDPDRIALAFSSDLAKIGERQLNSNYSPAFAR
jgi:hypothetical protein